MKKMQEKNKMYNIQAKAPTPSQTKPYGWQTPIFQTQEGSKKSTRFLNAKDHTPPETNVNHKLPLKLRKIKSIANSTKDADFP
jgi:hypothetical protein